MSEKIVEGLLDDVLNLPSRFFRLPLDYFSQQIDIIFCPNSFPVSAIAVVYWEGHDHVWEIVIRFIKFHDARGQGIACISDDVNHFANLPKEIRKSILREIGYHYYDTYAY